MQSNYHTLKRSDNQLLVITHLSQLLTYFTGFGGLIVPLILWLTQRDRVDFMDEHGKGIINFQLSLIIYYLVSIPLIFLFGLGIITLMITCIIGFILPIVNAVKASNNEGSMYPFTINFIN